MAGRNGTDTDGRGGATPGSGLRAAIESALGRTPKKPRSKQENDSGSRVSKSTAAAKGGGKRSGAKKNGAAKKSSRARKNSGAEKIKKSSGRSRTATADAVDGRERRGDAQEGGMSEARTMATPRPRTAARTSSRVSAALASAPQRTAGRGGPTGRDDRDAGGEADQAQSLARRTARKGRGTRGKDVAAAAIEKAERIAGRAGPSKGRSKNATAAESTHLGCSRAAACAAADMGRESKEPRSMRPRQAPGGGVMRPHQRGVESEAQLRFRFASVLRISDNLVNRAVQAYDRIFDIGHEEKAEIFLEMGQEFARTGKRREALSALRRAINLRPDLPIAWIEIGRLHQRERAHEAAEQAFLKAKELGSLSPSLYGHLAETLMEQGRDSEAIEQLEYVVSHDPSDPRIWYRLGVLNDRLGRHDEAVEAFEQAIDLDPEDPVFYQGLGFTLETEGHRSEAIKCFKRALELEQRELC